MEDKDERFITERCLDNMTEENWRKVDNALCLMLQWKQSNSIIFDYLHNTLTEPIMKMMVKFETQL